MNRVKQIVMMAFASLLAQCVWAAGYTTLGYEWTYIFHGGAETEGATEGVWNTLGNWGYTEDSGTTWTDYATQSGGKTSAPAVKNGSGNAEGAYDPMLIDGSFIEAKGKMVKQSDGKYHVVVNPYGSNRTTLEGWHTRLGAVNNVDVKVAFNKLQSGNTGFNKQFSVDRTSKITITKLESGPQAKEVDVNVLAPEGLTFGTADVNCNFLAGSCNWNISLGDEGSIKVYGNLSGANYLKFKDVSIDPTSDGLAKRLSERILFTYTGTNSGDFAPNNSTAANASGNTVTLTKKESGDVSVEDEVGTYQFVNDTTAKVIKVVYVEKTSVVLPDATLVFEPTPSALTTVSPSSFLSSGKTGWDSEQFVDSKAFVLGPNGIYCPTVQNGCHPWQTIPSKDAYSISLYADIEDVSTDDERILISLGNQAQGHIIAKNTDGQIILRKSGTDAAIKMTTDCANLKGWHLYTMTYDKTNLKLYIDGAEKCSIATTSNANGGMQIGSLWCGVSGFDYVQGYGMAVSGVYGYDSCLSAEQVALLAASHPAVTRISVGEFNPDVVTTRVHDATITTMKVAYGKTIDIVGSVTAGTEAKQLKGKVNILKDATLAFSGTVTDGIDWSADASHIAEFNVYGTLNMGQTRWTVGANNRIRVYGGIISGTGNGEGCLDLYGQDTTILEFHADGDRTTPSVTCPMRARKSGCGISVDDDVIATISGTIGQSERGSLNKTGNGMLVLSGSNSYAGGTTITAGTITTSVVANLNGKTFSVAENGTLEFANNGNKADFDGNDLSNITGAGKIKFSGTGYLAIPSDSSNKLWASTLEVVNELSSAMLMKEAATYTIGSLSGSGMFRYDWGDNGRTLKINQSKATTWSGGIFNSTGHTDASKNRSLNILVTSENDSVLTVSGTPSCGTTTLTSGTGGIVKITNSCAGVGVVLDGGKLQSTGSDGAHGTMVKNLALNQDGTYEWVEGNSTQIGIGASNQASTLDLNNHTLTLIGKGTDRYDRVYLDKTTIQSAGTIHVTKGHLFLHCGSITAPAGTKIIIDSDASIACDNQTLSVPELEYNGTQTVNSADMCEVTVTSKFAGTGSIPKLTLGDGAEVSGSATVTTSATAEGTVTLADGATLTVPTAFTANTVKSGVATKRVVMTTVAGGTKYSLETIQPEPPTPTEDGIKPSIPGADTIVIVDAEGTSVTGGKIPLTTGVYMVTGKVGDMVVGTQNIGVVSAKAAETTTDRVTTAVAVPFKGKTVATLLNTALLKKDDTLMAWIGDKYETWMLDADKNWVAQTTHAQAGDHTAPAPAEAVLKCGQGVWVTTAGQVVTFGDMNATGAVVELTTGHNLLGNPTMAAGYVPASNTDGDVTVKFNGKRYTHSGAKWTTYGVKKVINGEEINGDIEEDPEMSVGEAFWFIKK